MFMVNSVEARMETQIVDVAHPSDDRGLMMSPKTKEFDDLSLLLQKWLPSDVKASRKVLSNEIMSYLDDNGYRCIKSCIPSIIVEGQYPIDLIHCHTDREFDEFLTRMMWMHEVFGMALGIVLGASEDEQALAKIEEACESLLTEKDCLVFLL